MDDERSLLAQANFDDTIPEEEDTNSMMMDDSRIDMLSHMDASDV